MRLKIVALTNVASVNDFSYATEITNTSGDAVDLYFQLWDQDKNLSQHGFSPAGLRYMPPATSTLAVTFKNIDDALQFTRYATQPFPLDSSIWKVAVLATDNLQGTVNLKVVLTEPGAVTKTTAAQAVFQSSIRQ